VVPRTGHNWITASQDFPSYPVLLKQSTVRDVASHYDRIDWMTQVIQISHNLVYAIGIAWLASDVDIAHVRQEHGNVSI
jgi:hypothetical protein